MNGLVHAYMLKVDGKATAVVASLEAGQLEGQSYIDAGREVAVETTSGLLVEWYYDRTDKMWVQAARPGLRFTH